MMGLRKQVTPGLCLRFGADARSLPPGDGGGARGGIDVNKSLLLRENNQVSDEPENGSIHSTRSEFDHGTAMSPSPSSVFCFLFKKSLLFLGRKRLLLIVTFIFDFLKTPFRGTLGKWVNTSL